MTWAKPGQSEYNSIQCPLGWSNSTIVYALVIASSLYPQTPTISSHSMPNGCPGWSSHQTPLSSANNRGKLSGIFVSQQPNGTDHAGGARDSTTGEDVAPASGPTLRSCVTAASLSSHRPTASDGPTVLAMVAPPHGRRRAMPRSAHPLIVPPDTPGATAGNRAQLARRDRVSDRTARNVSKPLIYADER